MAGSVRPMHPAPAVRSDTFRFGAAWLATACALAVACGGAATSKQTPPGDDVGDDYGDDVACVTPRPFQSCSENQVACPDYVDGCAEPYSWVCSATYGWQLVVPASCRGGDAQVPPSDGGCIQAAMNEACTTTEFACQPSNPCCTGYQWVCSATPGTTGTWQKEGLGCACNVPFACGPQTCAGNTFCEVQPPGIAGPDGSTFPDTYECVLLPSACLATPTCACIEGTLSPSDTCSTQTPGVTCTSDGNGHVTIDCLGE